MLIGSLFLLKVPSLDFLMSLLWALGLTELKLLGALGDSRNLSQLGPSQTLRPCHRIAPEAEAKLIARDMSVYLKNPRFRLALTGGC